MMRFPKQIQLFAVTVVAGAIVGCSSVPLRLGPGQNLGPTAGPGRPVSGEACGFQLTAFIPINVLSRNERAYKQMMEAAGGDVVTDIRMQESWTFAGIGWTSCTTITGTAYPLRQA